MVLNIRAIPIDLENQFRSIAVINFGYRKGTLLKAVIEALEYYTFNQEEFKKWKMDRKMMKRAITNDSSQF